MECNKDEAKKAMDIAEKKLSLNDFNGAKKFVNKAQNLYPQLDGLKQVLMMINVYISASNKINGGGEADWYRILGVDPLADDEAVKKQYKKLALLLHPDKNKCKGAEGAFKLVSAAWCLLSDKVKRFAYDQKRKSKEAKTRMQKPPNPQKPATSDKPKPAPANSSEQRKGNTFFWTMCSVCKAQSQYLRDSYLNKAIRCPNCGQTFIATEKTPQPSFVKPGNFSSSSPQQQQRSAQNKATNKNGNGASSSGTNPSPSASATQKTQQASAKSQATNKNTNGASSSGRNSPPQYANATGQTPQASGQDQATNSNTNDTSSWTFTSPSITVTVKTPQGSFVRPVVNVNVSSSSQPQQQWSTQNQSTGQNTSGGTYSERTNSSSSPVSFSCSIHWQYSIPATTSSDGGNAANQAQETPKRGLEESREKVDASAAARGNANSTFEAARLFKRPMTTGNLNSTSEAARLFKRPMTTGNPNSTSEAARIFMGPMTTGNPNSTSEAAFMRPMTTGNPNSTSEAERLFNRLMRTGNTTEAERLFKKG